MFSVLYFLLYFFISYWPTNTWIHGVEGQPTTFLATKATSDSEKMVSDLIYRKLLYQDPKTGEVKLDLLEDYQVIEEGLVYEVTLKEGQYWQDGTEITADDILYTASISKNLSEVSSDKINDYKVRFILPNRYSGFTSVLSLNLLPSHMKGNDNPLRPIGSSSYYLVRLKKDRAKIKEVYLINRENTGFKRLIIKFYDNEEDLLAALRLREVDSVLSNRNETFPGFSVVANTFYSRAYLLIFNTKKDYLTQEVRQSISKSIDYDLLIENQEYENAVRPHGPLSGTWADSDSYEQINFDPEFSFSLSKELVLVIPKVRQAKLIAKNITEQFKENDVASVKTVILDKENYVRQLKDIDYDMVLIAQEYGLDPDRYVFWHSSQNDGGLNLSYYAAIRTDKSLEEGRQTTDIEKRKEHYDIFQSVFAEESLATYLVHPTQYFYYSTKLDGDPSINAFYPWEVLNNIRSWKKAPPKIIF